MIFLAREGRMQRKDGERSFILFYFLKFYFPEEDGVSSKAQIIINFRFLSLEAFPLLILYFPVLLYENFRILQYL